MNRTLFTATIRLRDEFSRGLGRARRETEAFGRQSQRSSRDQDQLGRSLRRTESNFGGYSRGARAASAATSGLSRMLGFAERRLAGLARTARYSLLFGSFGLSTIFTGAITTGIKFNATMEQNETALKNFLGSTKAARKELAILYGIAKTTPFEVADVTDAARKFLAFGFNVKQTNSYLRTLADASASTGAGAESMQRIVLAIGQIQAKGRVQGDELLQLTEAGIPAYKILGEELGLTKKQIGNIGKEQIPASRAIEALMRGMNKLYAGASVAQSKTFFGMWSSFKDTAKQSLGAVTKGLFVEAKEWLRTAQGFAEDTEKIWKGPGSVGQKAGETWSLITDGFTRWLNSDGESTIAAGGRKLGEIFAGAINAIFGVGGEGGEQSPFYRAGRTAVTSFISGFVDNLKKGDMLTSPVGRILEGYFLLKFGPRLLRKIGGTKTNAAQGLGDAISGGPNGSLTSPFYVINIGGPGGGGGRGGPVGGPGGKGRPDANPYSTGKGGKPGSAPTKTGKWGRIAGMGSKFGGAARLAGRAGPLVAFQMGYDALTRDDHNPFGSAVDIGRFAGNGLRGMFGMDDEGLDSTDALNRLRADPRYARVNFQNETMRRERAKRGAAARAKRRRGARPSLGDMVSGPDRDLSAATEIAPTVRAATPVTNASIRTLFTDATKTVKRAAPALRKETTNAARLFAGGFNDGQAKKLAMTGAQAIIAAAKAGVLASGVSVAGSSVAAGVANVAGGGSNVGASLQGPLGDAPNGPGGGLSYQMGQKYGAAIANSFNGGMANGLGSAAPGGAGAGLNPSGGGDNGGLGGNWGGSQPLAEGIARLSGLPVSSRKRGTKYTASGGVSDHWTGSTDAYAVDLPTTPPAGDVPAARIAAALGVPDYAGGYWINKNIGGYRYQLGWRVPGHYDHIHAGVNKLHGGGTFRAPSPGGEGLALLRDRERVVPASGNGAGRSGGRSVTMTIEAGAIVIQGSGLGPDELMSVMADAITRAGENLSTVSVED